MEISTHASALKGGDLDACLCPQGCSEGTNIVREEHVRVLYQTGCWIFEMTSSSPYHSLTLGATQDPL
eukprot:766001-Hanusia_phi.AAC.1